jgi:hypothetical protein
MGARKTDATGRPATKHGTKDLSPEQTKDVKAGAAYRGRYQLRLDEARGTLNTTSTSGTS